MQLKNLYIPNLKLKNINLNINIIRTILIFFAILAMISLYALPKIDQKIETAWMFFLFILLFIASLFFLQKIFIRLLNLSEPLNSEPFALTSRGRLKVMENSKRSNIRLFLVIVVVLRVLSFSLEPSLSDDWYRYIHEGRATRIDLALPYQHAPETITPPIIDDGISQQVNHPNVKASYPPLSQYYMACISYIGDFVGHPLLLWKLSLVFLDILLLILLFRRKKSLSGFIRYALHPLPIIEIYWNAHLDTVGMFLVIYILLFIPRIKIHKYIKAFLIAVAMGIKPIAIFLLVASERKIKSLFKVLLLIATSILLLYAPYIYRGISTTEGMTNYAIHWEANASLFYVAKKTFEPLFIVNHQNNIYTHFHYSFSITDSVLILEQAGQEIWSFGVNKIYSPNQENQFTKLFVDERLLAKVLMLLVFFIFVLLGLRIKDKNRAVMWLLSLFFIIAPTMHPWYFLWALPLACVYRNIYIQSAASLVLLTYMGSHYGFSVKIEFIIAAILLYGFFRELNLK